MTQSDADDGIPAREFLREIHTYVDSLSEDVDADGTATIDPSEVIGRLITFVDGLAYILDDVVAELEGSHQAE